jgi:hypothetical protein
MSPFLFLIQAAAAAAEVRAYGNDLFMDGTREVCQMDKDKQHPSEYMAKLSAAITLAAWRWFCFAKG